MKKEQTLKNITHAYLVGIKGVGMASLAIILKQKGMRVSGSDVAESFVTDETLHTHKIPVVVGFKQSNITSFLTSTDPQSAVVIVTGAHRGKKNPEAVAAQKAGISVLSHAEAVGLLTQEKKTISVAGTHGKTTTTAMIAHIMKKTKQHPSYLIGAGSIASLPAPGAWDDGTYFVVEADEYVADPQTDKTPRFHYHHPHISLITSIDFDHPDVFDSLASVQEAFAAFISQTAPKGRAIINADDDDCRTIAQNSPAPVITYGSSESADVHVSTVSVADGNSHFDVQYKKRAVCTVKLSIPGLHNIHNATAALAAAYCAGVSWKDGAHALASFAGTKRRFETVYESEDMRIIDDYAHHPAEIVATIQAARARYPESRIIALFQPHTFSRTKKLYNEFITAFSKAHMVALAPIFSSAREKKDDSISSRDLVAEIKKQNPASFYVRNADEFIAQIVPEMRPNDILLTMGAGDIYTWHETIISALSKVKK